MGSRANNYTSALLTSFKFGTTVTFKVGYKFFYNPFFSSQSNLQENTFTYSVVDSGQPKIPNTPMSHPTDPVPIWFQVFSSPKKYVLSNYTNSSAIGIVATINTLKAGNHYGVIWNVQANYLTLIDVKLVMWFSPMWVKSDSSLFANFICTDTISSNLHKWNFTQTYGITDGSSIGGVMFTDDDVWMSAVDPSKSNDGWYSANCLGGRFNDYDSSLLSSFKLSDRIVFRAGA